MSPRYPEWEGTLKDHWAQVLALNNVVQTLLNSGRLGTVTTGEPPSGALEWITKCCVTEFSQETGSNSLCGKDNAVSLWFPPIYFIDITVAPNVVTETLSNAWLVNQCFLCSGGSGVARARLHIMCWFLCLIPAAGFNFNFPYSSPVLVVLQFL